MFVKEYKLSFRDLDKTKGSLRDRASYKVNLRF